MEALLYFVLWAGLIFLMMRLCGGAHIMGHNRARGGDTSEAGGKPAELRWVPPKKDVDPVCRQTVETDTAKPSVFDGNVFYFCSRECREAFEAAPDIYAGDGMSPNPRQLENSHV
jgi:YHS domain-containing protein